MSAARGPAPRRAAPARTLEPPTVRVLVCGHAEHGDDGAALSAVATILPTLDRAVLARLEIRRCGRLRVEDLRDLPAGALALLVDTASGIPPGQVTTVPLGRVGLDPVAPAPRAAREDHLGDVLERIRAERPGGLPEGSFVGIGGRRFGVGRPLSRSVRLNLPAFRAAIAAEAERLSALPASPVVAPEPTPSPRPAPPPRAPLGTRLLRPAPLPARGRATP